MEEFLDNLRIIDETLLTITGGKYLKMNYPSSIHLNKQIPKEWSNKNIICTTDEWLKSNRKKKNENSVIQKFFTAALSGFHGNALKAFIF